MSDLLELIIGDAEDFDIFLVDENDNAENLASVTNARFTMKDGDTTLLDKDTAGGGIAINVSESKLVVSMSQAEADALTDTIAVGQAAIEVASKWKKTEAFYVRIKSSYVEGSII